jgi:hypothetical protein
MDSRVIIPLKWLSRDGRLLLAARTLRTFAYGFVSVILAIYLKLVGFNDDSQVITNNKKDVCYYYSLKN